MAPAGRIPADEETNKEEPTTNRRTRSPGNHRVSSAARLVSSSELSSLQATTTSSTSSDADSGIGGVSPRVSAAAFGESTLSPSQSILYIDSISARNSVFHDTTKAEKQPADDSTNEPEEKSNSTLLADEGSFTDPGTSVLVVEGDPRRDRAHRIALELLHTQRTYVDVWHLLDQVLLNYSWSVISNGIFISCLVVQVFQFRIEQENRAHGMFAQHLIPQMFSNIKTGGAPAGMGRARAAQSWCQAAATTTRRARPRDDATASWKQQFHNNSIWLVELGI